MEKEKKYLPLLETIYSSNYMPTIEKFERISQNVDENSNFANYFPNYKDYINNKMDPLIGIELKEKYDEKKEIENNDNDLTIRGNVKAKFIKRYLINNIPKHEEEIINFIGDKWKNLKIYTKVHTTIFLYFAIQMMKANSAIFSYYDLNIMYWTILFHDTGKHIALNPFFKEDFSDYPMIIKDKAHPFKSVIIFLNSLFEKNIIFFSDEKCKNKFKSNLDVFTDCLYKSFVEINSKGKYNISFTYINEIDKFLDYLHKEEKNSWIYDITVLILFHQSLPNHDKHMNNPLLPDEYILKYFDLRLFEMMKIIMICDAASHDIIDGQEWVEQINKHLILVKNKIIANNKKNNL